VISHVKGEMKGRFIQNVPIYDLFRLHGLTIMEHEKWRFLLAHPCVNPRGLSHFAWRSVGSSL